MLDAIRWRLARWPLEGVTPAPGTCLLSSRETPPTGRADDRVNLAYAGSRGGPARLLGAIGALRPDGAGGGA